METDQRLGTVIKNYQNKIRADIINFLYKVTEKIEKYINLLKGMLLETEDFNSEERSLTNDKKIYGRFMFRQGKNYVNQLFKTGFGGVIKRNLYSASDIIESSECNPSKLIRTKPESLFNEHRDEEDDND